MPYIVLDNFALGIDRRRPIFASSAGSLWDVTNGHISRGGDVEKRKSFVAGETLDSSVIGMCAGVNEIYVFGSASPVPAVPAGYTYVQTIHPTTPATQATRLISAVLFDGAPYCSVEFADGNIFHYYDGTLNSDMQSAGTGDFVPKVGRTCFTFRSKVYTLADSLLEFSGINVPLGWDTVVDTGAGYINLANIASGSVDLKGIEVFQGNLALLAERSVQIWYIREDEAENYLLQTLSNTGTIAPRSVLAYGDIDVFYLDFTGIRSLRARVPSNAAFINDIGTRIDPYVREWRNSVGDEDVVAKAVSLIEPQDSRFWMIADQKVFVLSYFPQENISAWTSYNLEDENGAAFTMKDAIVFYDKILILDENNTVYTYGGTTGEEYDANTRVTVELPFVYGNKPNTIKSITGVDIASEGVWSIEALVDPRDLTRKVTIGDLESVTVMDGHAAGFVWTSHIAPILINEAAGYASLSQVMITYTGADDQEQ